MAPSSRPSRPRGSYGVALAPLTTLGIGGPAARLVRATSIAELTATLEGAEAEKARVLVLGGGSNIVVDDDGFDGLVVQIAIDALDVARTDSGVRVTAGAGVAWDALVSRASVEGWVGIECMSGIPGWVGATPMQNVGAYGQEVGDTIVEVAAFDRETGAMVRFDRESCDFSYRHSVFRGSDRHVIVSVTFAFEMGPLAAKVKYAELARALDLKENDRAPLELVRETVIALRRAKGMVVDAADPESRSAGSFFVNPLVTPEIVAKIEALRPSEAVPHFPALNGQKKLSAAWLIERSGFAKGFTVGRVGISKKHALALVNRGGATSKELLAFARTIQDRVHAEFGIELSREPIVVPAR